MDVRDCCVPEGSTIREAVQSIDNTRLGIALIVDNHNKLKGIVTDADIRHHLLQGINLDSPVSEVMNRNPITASINMSREEVVALAKRSFILQVPVLDCSGRVIKMEYLPDLISTREKENWVIILAGGVGTRLKPLTDDLPKPMLNIGNRPILETLLKGLTDCGFKNYLLAVNYKAPKVKEYFGDGLSLGINIRYIEETCLLGTAGALSLIPPDINLDKSFIVMNGDLLTNLDYNRLMEYHGEKDSCLTVCVKELDYQLPYGVVKIDRGLVTDIIEKPIQAFFINAGIYVVDPKAIHLVPHNQYFDMTLLIKALIRRGEKVICFPLREYWIDIGMPKDYLRACSQYTDYFSTDTKKRE